MDLEVLTVFPPAYFVGLLSPCFHLVLLGDRNKNKSNHFTVCLELLYLAQVQDRMLPNTVPTNLLVCPCFDLFDIFVQESSWED